MEDYGSLELFFKKHELTFKDREFIVCWSGGKDSTALLALLSKILATSSTPLDALFVPYPSMTFNFDHLDSITDFWLRKHVKLNVIQHDHSDPKDLPFSKACSHCKSIRRAVLAEEISKKHDLSRIALITGHNLSDLAAYFLEIFIRKLGPNNSADKSSDNNRYLENTNKFRPIYIHPAGPMIIRPLLEYDHKNVFDILAAFDIPPALPWQKEACPWTRQRKRLLQEYFEVMDLRFTFSDIEEAMRQHCGFPEEESFGVFPYEFYLF